MVSTHASIVLGISLSLATSNESVTRLDKEQLAENAAASIRKPEFAMHAIETQLIAATNAARARQGMPPLRMDAALVRTARRHTSWMTRAGSLQHSSGNYGENIAMGQPSVSSVIHSWMTSPGHRANMLSGRYTRIGVAAYRAPNGTIYWCQQFGW